MKDIQKEVRRDRKKLGWTLAELMKKAGLGKRGKQQISELELGGSHIKSYWIVVKIRAALDKGLAALKTKRGKK